MPAQRPRRAALLGPVCLALLWSCESGSPGALDQIDFAPECGSLDQACLTKGLDAPIAVGASLELGINFKLQGSSGPPMQLQTVDESVFLLDESRVKALEPGVRALLVSGPDGLILDFIHIWVALADELRMVRHTADGVQLGQLGERVQMIQGDDLYLTIEPFGASQRLLGNFDVDWEETGEAVSVLDDGVLGAWRIVAREPGTTELKAMALGREISLTVEVLP